MGVKIKATGELKLYDSPVAIHEDQLPSYPINSGLTNSES